MPSLSCKKYLSSHFNIHFDVLDQAKTFKKEHTYMEGLLRTILRVGAFVYSVIEPTYFIKSRIS